MDVAVTKSESSSASAPSPQYIKISCFSGDQSLGPRAFTIFILKKLDSIHGIVAEREDILAECYIARQGVDEECARWN